MRSLILITGVVNSGKTTYLHKLISEYRQKGKTVGGFTAEAFYKKGEKIGYDACDLRSGAQQALVRSKNVLPPEEFQQERYQPESYQRVGRFLLLASGLDFCRRCIDDSFNCDVVCIDEIGPLEMAGGGHRRVFEKVLSDYASTLIVVAREEVVDPVIKIAEKAGWAVEVVYVQRENSE